MANNIVQTTPRRLPPGRPLNMLLIGKTGSGKSATGNTILEVKQLFKSSFSAVSCTRENKSEERNVGGRVLNVVDTPGFMDTQRGDDVLKDIADAVTTHPEGYDAFLIVLKFPIRMTNEEVQTFKQMEDLFGKNIYDYAIVICTNGDGFENMSAMGEVPSFQEFVEQACMSQDENALGPLFRNVKKRVLLFNNCQLDAVKRREQTYALTKLIDGNVTHGRYTDDIFRKAQELKSQGLSLKERVVALVGYLKNKFIEKCIVM